MGGVWVLWELVCIEHHDIFISICGKVKQNIIECINGSVAAGCRFGIFEAEIGKHIRAQYELHSKILSKKMGGKLRMD